jgi:hypothetical protein
MASARKNLRAAIKKAQANSWTQLCSAVDEDPWGLPYRLVMKKVVMRVPIEPEREKCLAAALLPFDRTVDWVSSPSLDDAVDPELFTLNELRLTASRLPGRKASGPDLIPNEVVAVAIKTRPGLILELFNKCLSSGVFPARWMVARLVW